MGGAGGRSELSAVGGGAMKSTSHTAVFLHGPFTCTSVSSDPGTVVSFAVV